MDARVIKIGVRPEMVRRVDRVRLLMEATRPECVRTAVSLLLRKGGSLPVEKPKRANVGRCDYWKVPFAGATVERIEEIAKEHGKSRQQVVLAAIESMLDAYV